MVCWPLLLLLGWALGLLALVAPAQGAPGDTKGVPITLAVECIQRLGTQQSTRRHRLQVTSGEAVVYRDSGLTTLQLELAAQVDPAGGIHTRQRVKVPGGSRYEALSSGESVVGLMSPGAPFKFRIDDLEVEVRVLLAAVGTSEPQAAPKTPASDRCSRCAGSGACGGCKGSGRVDCHNCSATGKCSYCNGSGCPTCNGAGTCGYCSGEGYTQLCAMCTGSGRCYYCSGRGTP